MALRILEQDGEVAVERLRQLEHLLRRALDALDFRKILIRRQDLVTTFQIWARSRPARHEPPVAT